MGADNSRLNRRNNPLHGRDLYTCTDDNGALNKEGLNRIGMVLPGFTVMGKDLEVNGKMHQMFFLLQRVEEE